MSPLPIDAVQVAVTTAAAAADSVAVNSMSLPSVASATAMLSVGIVPGVAALVLTASEASDQSLITSPLFARTCTW